MGGKKPQQNAKETDIYFSPLSKKIKFELTVKKRENAKVGTLGNASKSKKSKYKNINSIADSLKRP